MHNDQNLTPVDFYMKSLVYTDGICRVSKFFSKTYLKIMTKLDAYSVQDSPDLLSRTIVYDCTVGAVAGKSAATQHVGKTVFRDYRNAVEGTATMFCSLVPGPPLTCSKQ
ncbi:hypothetical protein SFRURICE_002776 [Spodoptera frugiperda]|nr:hypothetical protein SFRURICE_002776 [Spodoptera frugiperda]